MTRHFWTRTAALVFAMTPLSGAVAQVADPATLGAQRDAIAKLAWMDGTWRGPATAMTPDGEHKVTQTERIGTMLGGTIRVMEGKGFNPDGTIGFNAFGILSYNPATKNYALHSYAQGYAGDFKLTPTADGYVWEIPAGPMTIRYTATFTGTTWHEVGDRMVPGQPSQRFFDMMLTRVGDSAWPGAGGMAPK
ncbi:MAG: DUF1579 domain-containing protein [Sphingomonas bacterium]